MTTEPTATLCQDRVVAITGAGRGLGREHALEFARQGAVVVINDPGVAVDGSGIDGTPADSVVAEIERLGGRAVASYADAADVDGAQQIVDLAVDTFGRLDVMVNNAGILRDRMLINMAAAEWDSVIHVHLRSVFACSRAAAGYWRARSKDGTVNDARIINTTSPSGLYGNVGQSNYGAAKAGIAGFTIIAAQELVRYGVTVNAIAPGARTRMTESLTILDSADEGTEGFDAMAAGNVSPLVAWLGSTASADVNGRVFNIWGGRVSIAQGWAAGPGVDLGRRWRADEFSATIPGLVQRSAPAVDNWGDPVTTADL